MSTALLISVVAVILSGASLSLATTTYLRAKRIDKRDQFLKLNERLIDVDLQLGRRILYRVGSVEDAVRLQCDSPEEDQLVNRALAMFEVLALYIDRNYVDKDLALETWGHTYAGCYPRAEYYIAARLGTMQNPWSAWPNLQKFGPRAAKWAAENPQSPTTRIAALTPEA